MAKTDQKVVVGPLRCGYVNVFAPRENSNNGKEEYSLQLIIPKSEKAAVKKLRTAIDAVIEAKWGDDVPKKLWDPLIDAEAKFDEDGKSLPDYLEGCYIMNVKNVRRPGVVDKNLQEVLDATEFQSGDYARVSLNLYAFDNVLRGVGASLQNVQVIKKGEPLGSQTRASDDFEAFEDDEDWDDAA